jgi:two-component system alkaline phosphatase synthesis response regulator PhoP
MIFCVEDDDAIRDLMIYALHAAGFEAKGFAEATSFFEALQAQMPQLVILDIMLPGEDGLAILKKLRAQTETVTLPVIMATAKGTEYDKVIGLDLGADDYLVKPFGMMEMVSRVRAILRRTHPKDERQTLQVGTITLHPQQHMVYVDGARIELTRKEYKLLKLFMENLGLVFTREQLLERIWGMDFLGETRTVDVHIGTLRTKLGSCGVYITTLRGIGYRMEVSA